MSEREVIEKLKEQLGSADRQIKRLIKTERRLLDLEEKMQRILKRYKCLQDISNFILSTRDIQKIFNFICEKFVFEMEVEKAVVLLKEKNFLSLKACAGYSRDESHSLLIKKFSLDFPILKEILEKGNLLIGPEKEIPLAFEEEFKMCHILGFAIFGEAKNALGIFLIGISKEKLHLFPHFTKEDIVVFSPLITQLGTSLELFNLLSQFAKKVEEKTMELQARIRELEVFTKVAVEREIKMIELKKEVKKLKEELAKYKEKVSGLSKTD